MSNWFVTPKPVPAANLRLICLPYAGGSTTTFLPWQDQLPKGVELVLIQPPGRAERFNEPPHSTMKNFVDDLVSQITSKINTTYALFGHSLGGLAGYELIKRLTVMNARLPAHFIASGSRAPHIKCKNVTYNLDDKLFLNELNQMNGTPQTILQNQELMELYLPLLRADFQVAETYCAPAGELLKCNYSVFAGRNDPGVSQCDLDGWHDHFDRSGEIKYFDGDHFFIEENHLQVVHEVRNVLLNVLSNSNGHDHL